MRNSSASERGRPVLYHLHIPKTAGTTLYALLEARYAADKVSPVSAASWDLLKIPQETFSQFDLIGGHLEFGKILPEIVGRPVRPIAMLREPRAVLLSLYKQVMQEPRDPLRPYIDANCPTIEAFFFDPKVSKYVADTQARFLGFTERRFTHGIVEQLRGATPETLPGILAQIRKTTQPGSAYELLHHARRRLAECEVVGLVERFNDSFAQICHVLDWAPSVPVSNKNVSQVKVSEKLPDHLLKRLDELSPLDGILYEEAKMRFQAETARPVWHRRAA